MWSLVSLKGGMGKGTNIRTWEILKENTQMFFLGGGEAKKIVGCSMCSWIVRWCCVVLCWLIIGSLWEILTYLEARRPGKYSLIHDDWSYTIFIYIFIIHTYQGWLGALVKFVFNTELKHHDSRLVWLVWFGISRDLPMLQPRLRSICADLSNSCLSRSKETKFT